MARDRSASDEPAVFTLIGLVCLPLFLIQYIGWKAYLMSGFFLLILVLLWFVHFKDRGDTPEPNSNSRPVAVTLQTTVPKPAFKPVLKPVIKPAPEPLEHRLRRLDWYQFEKLMAVVFQQQGYTVQRSGGARPDGGVDLLIERQGQKTVVQCKHWKVYKVGVKEIREFLGTLTDVGIRNGTFITLHKFTDEARALAQKHNIQLLGQPELLRVLESVNWRFNSAIIAALDKAEKRCPRCESLMVLRTAKRGPNPGGQFWGCSSYPKCHFRLDYTPNEQELQKRWTAQSKVPLTAAAFRPNRRNVADFG